MISMRFFVSIVVAVVDVDDDNDDWTWGQARVLKD